MNLKPSDLSDARIADARKPGDNRFERWLRQRKGNGLLLLLGFVFLLFAFDSILAFALVLSGLREADLFYATAWMSTRAADHANLPGLREVLPRHPRLYGAYSDRFEADGLLGGRLVRNFLTIAPSKKLDWAEKSFWFMTTDQGFPPVEEDIPHYAIPKPAGVFRVIVIGGSTVEGNGVNSPLDSLPAKLQGLFDGALREHPDAKIERVEVVNAGVSNYASDSEYLYLLVDLLRFQPNLVLAYDGWNDAEVLPTWISGDRQTRPYRSGPQQDNEERVNASFTPIGALQIAAAIASQHALGFLDGFATFKLLHVVLNLTAPPAVVESPYDPAYSRQAAQFYIENRERMLALARQNGFRFASLLQPIMGVDGKDYAASERAHSSLITPTQMQEREVFYGEVRPLLQSFKAAHEEGDVCVADLSDTVFTGRAEPVYADDGHLLPAGNQIVAKRVMDELRRCRLLPF
ncbi:SGNH/GDSL hydrolase family protein [Methylocapsa polymorpha]|uniref:SGNH/GDSL hydrolase family protein n=1 Tax=Methylocapsa polymorpha TaxID=3080828 RepID=A0ABZ0HUX0_9HYPH|nr:SGNH/GDSL hydrolase family protein [Methylocapsa sp. RX1]